MALDPYLMKRTSVTMSREFYDKARQHHLKFSECLRKGISLELAERGVEEYDNQLNIIRKLRRLAELLEETINKLNNMKQNK